jgi:hypothetical protein
MTSSMHGATGYGSVRKQQKSSERGGGEGDYVPSGFRKGRINQYNPDQERVIGEWGDEMGPDSYLSRLAGGDEDLFNDIEAPAHRQFQEKIGQLSSRFSGMGTGGRHSSGFQNEGSAASSNFAQDLQAQRQGLTTSSDAWILQGMRDSFLGQRQYDDFLIEKGQKTTQSMG